MKKNRNILLYLLAGLIATAMAIGMASNANAGVINIMPSVTRIDIGQSVDVGFRVSALTSAPGDSLSGFDLDILYDPSVLRLTGVRFIDPETGINQLDFAEPGGFGFVGAANPQGNRIDLFGLSGNSAGVLDARQNPAFFFTSLTFEAIASSALATVAIDLNDPNLLFTDSGSGLLPTSFANTSVNIEIGEAAAVPESSTLPLVLIGVFIFLLVRGRKTHPLRPIIAAAVLTFSLGGLSVVPTSASAQSQAQGESITGVVVAVKGQRLQVRLNSGTLRWFTMTVPLQPGNVGNKVVGVAVAAGDIQLLVQARFEN